MKIVMVAGGSGGHIYPAISLADELKKRGHEIAFIGANDRMEKDVIPSFGYQFIALDIKTTRGGIFQKFVSLYSIIKNTFVAKKILKDGYDLVIGFGNYISVPVLMAAKQLKIKTIIHEQNSYVGRANRSLDKHVDLVIASYEESLKQLQNPNKIVLGNPRSSEAIKVIKDDKFLKDLSLDSNKKTILIFMGSLGSESVQESLLQFFKMVDDERYQIIYATGKKNYEKAKQYARSNIIITESVDGIQAMKNADILVSRAGATTIAEIEAVGIASILIPSPYVPNNHQYHNAMALVDKKAAILLEEKDLSAQSLKENIDILLDDDVKRETLAKNAKALNNPNVIDDIISEVEKLWEQ